MTPALAPTPRDLLLSTKLRRPPRRANPVARPHLFERLDEGMTRRLTLISAPAGFGKTTLMTEWLARSHARDAWLSLDANDNDPTRFWTYVVAALRTLQPELGQNALGLLQAAPAPPIDAVLAALVNDLDAIADAFMLVLDDYHAIHSPAIHQALALLIEQLPAHMHLCILTRSNPALGLPRLRARDQLVELRASDLRFTSAEAAAFLGQAMDLRLTAEQIAALETRTEGWAAGLQLAALSMRGREDIDRFLTAFTGSHQYIIDYLVEEVLLRQPDPVQEFLVRTAILDRLCGPLCAAVLGTAGAQEVLERLQRDNLFIVSLDDERRWYRYHQLFADVLRHRLNKSTSAVEIAALHQRASDWHAQQGLPVEAINHALIAGDWDRFERLLRIHFDPLLFSGQVLTILGWLDKLPDLVMRARPHLGVRYATALLYINQQEKAEAYFQNVEQVTPDVLPPDEARSMLGVVAANRSSLVRSLGDIPRCLEIAAQAIDLLPAVYAGMHASLRINLSFAFLWHGRVSREVEAELRSSIAAARANKHEYAVLRGNMLLARLYALQARTTQALTACAEAIDKSPRPSRQYVDPVYHIVVGDLLLERNELDAAERHLRLGMDHVLGTLTVDADIVLLCHVAMARYRWAMGDAHGAFAILDSFAPLAQQRRFVPWLTASTAAVRAQVELALGRVADAQAWANTSAVRAEDEPTYPRERDQLGLARLLIAQHSAQDALRLLDRMLSASETDGRTRSTIEILVLRSLALRATGDATGACETLERALALAIPAGFVRMFVDEGLPMQALLTGFRRFVQSRDTTLLAYAENLLRAFGENPLKPSAKEALSQGLLEPLSERELEVLQIIAGGASNQEIASRLYLAVGTVKRHINNIFGKLGVSSRTQAIVRARELKLVD